MDWLGIVALMVLNKDQHSKLGVLLMYTALRDRSSTIASIDRDLAILVSLWALKVKVTQIPPESLLNATEL